MQNNDTKETARQRQLRERAERDYTALQALGMSTGDTFYPPGTEVMTASVRRSRRKFDELPLAAIALPALSEQVQNEDRLDVPAVAGGTYHPDKREDGTRPALYPAAAGGLMLWRSSDDYQTLAPTEQAWRQVQAYQPDDLRGVVPQGDLSAWWLRATTRDVVVRTRRNANPGYPSSTREAYAVVSPSYKPYDLDDVAADLAAIAPAGSAARVRYDGARARVDVVLQNPHRLDGGDGGAVGELHRVILRVRTADDGSGGYHLSLLAERVRCVNLTLLHASKSLMRASHRTDNLRDMARAALDQVEPILKTFGERWAAAWQEVYSERYTRRAMSGREALTAIVDAGKFRIPGLGAEGTLAAVLRALDEEPGDSKAHVHNAMTRAAHEAPVTRASVWADDDAEEQASQLLYNRVLVLTAPEPDRAALLEL